MCELSKALQHISIRDALHVCELSKALQHIFIRDALHHVLMCELLYGCNTSQTSNGLAHHSEVNHVHAARF